MITDIDTLKSIIPTIAGRNISLYASAIEGAEAWLSAEIVGELLIATIKAKETTDKAYKLAQKAIAFKAYYDAIPVIDLRETPNGFAVVNDSKLAPASTARIAALREAMANNLAATVEELQEYLEKTPQYHAEWLACKGCTILTSLIPTLTLYRRYGEFNGSRSQFATSSAIFNDITRRLIAPKISNELLDELIAQSVDNSLSEQNLTIIHQLRTALALYFSKQPNEAAFHLNSVRQRLEGTPSDFPAFESSKLYSAIQSLKPAEGTSGIGIFI